jgi:DMSO/TMAO reductase YedYZ molybdopterin-dependent catalytic subunit
VSKDKEALLEKVREFEERTGRTIDSWPADRYNTASVLNERRELSDPVTDDAARHQMRSRSRRGFIVGGVAGLLAIFGWRWMDDETKGGLLRKTFEFNERVGGMLYSNDRRGEIDPASWTVEVRGLAASPDGRKLTIEDIKRLPRTEMITELKCIEGWSVIVQWAGVRFSDFVAEYAGAGAESLPSYVSMATPDEKYFVGWDTPSIMHPQTLLAYEMNGAPLRPEHGAPLRLASPTKYGIKQIKRIGRIEFTNERPRDFWAESGYDWYSGH